MKSHLEQLFTDIISWETVDPPLMANNSIVFLQVLVSDTPLHQPTIHQLMASLRTDPDCDVAYGESHSHRKEFPRNSEGLRATPGEWIAHTSRDHSLEESCNKKGNSSGYISLWRVCWSSKEIIVVIVTGDKWLIGTVAGARHQEKLWHPEATEFWHSSTKWQFHFQDHFQWF